MKRLSELAEIIPALVVLVFIVAFAGLAFELVAAALKAKPADPVATGVLGTIIGACIPGLIALYLRDSKPLPPDPPAPPPVPSTPTIERTGDTEADEWNERHGWLQIIRRGVYRWKPS